MTLGLHKLGKSSTLATILSSLALNLIRLALVPDSNLFRHEPIPDIQIVLTSKPDQCP